MALAHGVVGGTASRLQGGKFATGFFSAGLTKLMTPAIETFADGNLMRGAMASAVVGGTATAVGGGKFANGAVTAAFGYLYNECGQGRCSGDSDRLLVDHKQNAIIYQRGDARVVVQNDVLENGIPQVSMERVLHALDVSAQETRAIHIISGYRDSGHTNASINHQKFNAIDAFIPGYDSTQTAKALYDSGHFHKVAGYPNSRLQTAHGDDRTSHRGGCFVEWGGARC